MAKLKFTFAIYSILCLCVAQILGKYVVCYIKWITDYMLYLVDKISVKEIDNWENEKD